MTYYEFEVAGEVYKLRLNTRNIVSLEKMLGCNPLMIFGAGDKVPEVTDMLAVLKCSLEQYQHGITMDKVYDIWDKYCEDHVITDFIPVIIEIYRVSGIIAKDTDEKN